VAAEVIAYVGVHCLTNPRPNRWFAELAPLGLLVGSYLGRDVRVPPSKRPGRLAPREGHLYRRAAGRAGPDPLAATHSRSYIPGCEDGDRLLMRPSVHRVRGGRNCHGELLGRSWTYISAITGNCLW
jgi:hypothetical protein